MRNQLGIADEDGVMTQPATRGSEDSAYQLLQRCLELVVSIDNEIVNLHNYMKDKYKIKFPELASFVHDAVQYAKSVQLIGNEMDLTKIDLNAVLPQVDLQFTYSHLNCRHPSDQKITIQKQQFRYPLLCSL